jgi:hypothetical protein
MTAEDDRPYVVESPTRIKLKPEAKYWAEQYGLSLAEFGRYLLQQHAQQQEQEQHASNFEGAGSGLSGEPSENVEDRRDENFVPDKTMQQIWGAYPHDVAPHAQTFGPNPLANALGFRDVGKRPAPAPQVLGPIAPQWPAQFGAYRPYD